VSDADFGERRGHADRFADLDGPGKRPLGRGLVRRDPLQRDSEARDPFGDVVIGPYGVEDVREQQAVRRSDQGADRLLDRVVQMRSGRAEGDSAEECARRDLTTGMPIGRLMDGDGPPRP
jgi:hypothetical protein